MHFCRMYQSHLVEPRIGKHNLFHDFYQQLHVKNSAWFSLNLFYVLALETQLCQETKFFSIKVNPLNLEPLFHAKKIPVVRSSKSV